MLSSLLWRRRAPRLCLSRGRWFVLPPIPLQQPTRKLEHLALVPFTLGAVSAVEDAIAPEEVAEGTKN